jgi:DNA modification methylase
MTAKIELADCLSFLRSTPTRTVDCVMTDPPYGTTYAPWDCDVPLSELWPEWARILKPGGAVVMTASQPFTSAAVMSNPSWFRCEWIWDRVNAANFANAKRQPMKTHESVLVFCDRQPTYNPQKVPGPPNHAQGSRGRDRTSITMKIDPSLADDDFSGMKYPKSIQTFAKHSSQCGLHPSQKPIELMRYLVRTYTNPGEVIADCFAGSGTTLLAAIAEGRSAFGCDNRADHVKTAQARLASSPLFKAA